MLKYLQFFPEIEDYFFDNGEMDPEDTAKLLKACFNYINDGDAHIDDLFPERTYAKGCWKGIQKYLETCEKKATQNAANGSKKTAGASDPDEPVQVSMFDEESAASPKKRTGANRSDAKRTKANSSEQGDNQQQDHSDKNDQKQYQKQQLDARAEGAAAACGLDQVPLAQPGTLIDLEAWEHARDVAYSARIIRKGDDTRNFAVMCKEAAPDCKPEWIPAAVAQCQKQHRTTWAYFAAILRGYQAAGGIDTREDARTPGSSAGARKSTGNDYEQRPNTENDGSAIPVWVLNMRRGEDPMAV